MNLKTFNILSLNLLQLLEYHVVNFFLENVILHISKDKNNSSCLLFGGYCNDRCQKWRFVNGAIFLLVLWVDELHGLAQARAKSRNSSLAFRSLAQALTWFHRAPTHDHLSYAGSLAIPNVMVIASFSNVFRSFSPTVL